MSGHTNNATPPIRQDARTPEWTMADVQEFIPRRLESAMVSPKSLDYVI